MSNLNQGQPMMLNRWRKGILTSTGGVKNVLVCDVCAGLESGCVDDRVNKD